MDQRIAVAIVGLVALCLSWIAPGTVLAQGVTGSIKGEITASGVRSPEDVVVFIESVPGEQKAPAEPAMMDQKKLTFVPHVLPIVKGTTVNFRNGDPVLHNVFWPASDDGVYATQNLGTWGQGDVEKLHLRQATATWFCSATSTPRWKATLWSSRILTSRLRARRGRTKLGRACRHVHR